MLFKKKRKGFFMITSVIVANNFIKKAINEGISLSPLKLQKLVYFLYKDYLQKTGNDLFNERFETWRYGPVLPSLYSEFMSFGSAPIDKFAKDSQDKIYMVKEKGIFKECISGVWTKYKDYSGIALSNLTHQEGTAWSLANDKRENFLNKEDIRNERELL